jgi:catechol-2,3-dioxygenase
MAAGNPHNSLKKVNLTHIAHVYYKHKDLAKAKQFLGDFGFSKVSEDEKTGRTYYRGYGKEPFVVAIESGSENEFGGAAFHVESEEDLVYAAKSLPKEANPTDVYNLMSPGGGKCVTFYDPVDKFAFHLVHGQEMVEPIDPNFTDEPVNYPTEKNRPANTFVRFQKRPAPVHKIGHFGLCVTNFAKSYEFYTTHFNFFPSEVSFIHTAQALRVR